MVEVIARRDDAQIESEIAHFIAHYPPLMKDRHAIKYRVEAGAVTVTGHTQTPNTRRFFLDHLAQLPGVTGVNADELYVDETIRLEAGKLTPMGVMLARVQYGVIVVAGQLPQGLSEEELGRQLQAIPGVKRVITAFNHEQTQGI